MSVALGSKTDAMSHPEALTSALSYHSGMAGARVLAGSVTGQWNRPEGSGTSWKVSPGSVPATGMVEPRGRLEGRHF
jgi:hypothetical protein